MRGMAMLAPRDSDVAIIHTNGISMTKAPILSRPTSRICCACSDWRRVAKKRLARTGLATAGKLIIDGNAAAALGSMFAGVTVVTWYPITPS